MINGLFVQVGWKFIANRGNPDAFEPAPSIASAAEVVSSVTAKIPNTDVETYTVNVNGQNFNVAVGPGGTNLAISTMGTAQHAGGVTAHEAPASTGAVVESPLAGNILKIKTNVGSVVAEGDVVAIMEAMKMETEIRSKVAGTVSAINIKEGDSVSVGDVLVVL